MNASAPIKAVMFDMDGTLVNSRAAIVNSYHDASTQVLGDKRPTDPAMFRGHLSGPPTRRGSGLVFAASRSQQETG